MTGETPTPMAKDAIGGSPRDEPGIEGLSAVDSRDPVDEHDVSEPVATRSTRGTARLRPTFVLVRLENKSRGRSASIALRPSSNSRPVLEVLARPTWRPGLSIGLELQGRRTGNGQAGAIPINARPFNSRPALRGANLEGAASVAAVLSPITSSKLGCRHCARGTNHTWDSDLLRSWLIGGSTGELEVDAAVPHRFTCAMTVSRVRPLDPFDTIFAVPASEHRAHFCDPSRTTLRRPGPAFRSKHPRLFTL